MRSMIHVVLGMSLIGLGGCAEQPGKKKEEDTKTETKTVEGKTVDGKTVKTETKIETKVEEKK